MRWTWLLVSAGLAGALSCPAYAQRPTDSARTVVVVTATPLDGAGVDLDALPAPVQTAGAGEIEASHALDLSEFLRRQIGSVYVNDVQNNPLQPDVNYRGFTASPLLGAQQGLSIYVDGVRLNQPFGDVVSWDLIPRAAIDTLALMPGSNPLFGLNTLGGALSIRTKSGRTSPGGSAELAYGSDDRWQAQASAGGLAGDGFDWFVTANRFEDDGWRDFSPSEATQAFGKLGWSGERTRLSLSVSLADTDLTGDGLQDQRLLARDYASIYTKPDNTQNRSGLATLTAQHELADDVEVSGVAWYRKITTRTLNGDINDDSLTESVYQPSAAERAALTAAGYTGFPTAGETAANTPFPSWRCIANILLNAEPNEKCNGLLNRSHTDQHESGVSAQATFSRPIAGRANQAAAGFAYVASRADFTQSTQYGYLTPDRGVMTVDGPGAFADGTQDSEDAMDARVDLAGKTTTYSLFATDTLEFAPDWRLTVSARYDESKVRNRDALTPSGPGSLSGDHVFSRVNPALGLTWSPNAALNLYAGYNEGSRAPSAVELGCSDPDAPCRLPNALAGDPPLKKVVTRTGEIGARGRLNAFDWRIGLFRAENEDDILFVADSISGFGYFKNFGRTRRQGAELALAGEIGAVSFGANYTWLDATYRTAEIVPGQGNSSNDAGPGFEGLIEIAPGDRIPLTPHQIFKANVDWRVLPRLSLSADAIAVDSSYARGDENNEHEPDGVYYLGPGKSGGYAVLNLGAEYRPLDAMKLFVQVSNVFDTEHHTAAQLGASGFTDDGAFIARPFAGPVVDGERPTRNVTFYAPGAPRMLWAGIKYSF